MGLFHHMDRTGHERDDARVTCAHEKAKKASKLQPQVWHSHAGAPSRCCQSCLQNEQSQGITPQTCWPGTACSAVSHYKLPAQQSITEDFLTVRGNDSLTHSQISNKNHRQCELAARAHVFINQDVNHGITKSSARQINILKTSRASKLCPLYDCFFHDSLSNWVQQQASLW